MNTCICYDIADVEKKIIISKIEDLFICTYECFTENYFI